MACQPVINRSRSRSVFSISRTPGSGRRAWDRKGCDLVALTLPLLASRVRFSSFSSSTQIHSAGCFSCEGGEEELNLRGGTRGQALIISLPAARSERRRSEEY